MWQRVLLRCPAVPRKNPPSLLHRLLPHLAMGVNLGSLFALTLIVMDAAHVRDTLSSLASPRLATLAFVLAASVLFAAGAGLTGLLYEQSESS